MRLLLICAILSTFSMSMTLRVDLKPVTPLDNLQEIVRGANPGDVITLADGNYPGGLPIRNRPGREDAPIFLKATNPGKAIFVGSTTLQRDGILVYSSPWWVLDGLVIERAETNGIRLGESDYTTVRNCRSWLNGGSGLLAGASSNGKIISSEFSFNQKEHGAYVSTVKGRDWEITDSTFLGNGKGGIQFNTQGTGTGISTGNKITRCSILSNGRTGQAAGINLLGAEALIDGCTLHDNRAGGIAAAGNGRPGEFSSVTVYKSRVTFREGEGRSCVLLIGGRHSVLGCTFAVGRLPSLPIETRDGASVTAADNTILLSAPAVAPGDLVPAPGG